MKAFDRDANVANLLVETEFTSRVLDAEKNWRKVVQTAAGPWYSDSGVLGVARVLR